MQDHHMFPGNRRMDRDARRKDPVDTGTIDFAAWVVALLAAQIDRRAGAAIRSSGRVPRRRHRTAP